LAQVKLTASQFHFDRLPHLVTMFRLSTVALVGTCIAFSDETSLMQGLKPAQEMKQGHDKKKAITNLLSTASSMLKNGATPDVIDFASATLAEITSAVIPAIEDASDTDQDSIMVAFAHFERLLVELENGVSETRLRHLEERQLSTEHKECRASEGQHCERKTSCDYDLYCTWQHFKQEEEEMRGLSIGIHDHFCAPGQNGTLEVFRTNSVGLMPTWIAQKPKPEYWEHYYDLKRPVCEEMFVELDQQTATCDGLQTQLEAAACVHRATQHETRTEFNSMWALYLGDYAALKAHVLLEETDRWNEFKTLIQVNCLLQATTGYNGRPCDETTVNSVQTDCEATRPQCTRNSEGIFGSGFGSSFVADDAAYCDICHIVDGVILDTVVRDRSNTIAEYQGLCNWFPVPPEAPCLCDAPYDINDGRCDPNPPPANCDSRFEAAEYADLWMPPMPDFHANQCQAHDSDHVTAWNWRTTLDETGNSHCNPRPECQSCQPGSPVDVAPQRAQCGASLCGSELVMVDGCLNQNTEVPRAAVSHDSTATASVRCCSHTSPTTCDTDHLPGGCQDGKTFLEAVEICELNGERLCTEDEISVDRLCCGTGCNFDGHQVWVGCGSSVYGD